MKLQKLEAEVLALYNELIAHETEISNLTRHVHFNYLNSAVNLLHYLILRNHDLRTIHHELSEHGISSLRSNESYVLKNVGDVLHLLRLLQGNNEPTPQQKKAIGYINSQKRIASNAHRLLGHKHTHGNKSIMVTLPTEAATDENIVLELLKNGMNIARINCSHDDEKTWQKMIGQVKQSSELLKTECKIYMDLPGPKIRTGSIKSSKKSEGIKLKDKDILHLSAMVDSGRPAELSKKGKLKRPAVIGMTNGHIIKDLLPGDRVFFDDGIIETIVVEKTDNVAVLRVRVPGSDKLILKPEKGINMPDTKINVPSLTKEDLKLIPFIVQHADMIGYSFLRSPQCVEDLLVHLKNQPNENLGLVLKIENKDAFEKLPQILLKAMEYGNVGVMIARGDLAVELGPIRLAEAQDEILWICEAAHIPVIWATQVLENLAKKGISSRAEITDAAKSARADCVMLNKGPHIVLATKTLKDILKKMESHTKKKKSLMRPLNIAITNMQDLEKLQIKDNFVLN